MKRNRLLFLPLFFFLFLRCESVKQKHIIQYVNDRAEFKTLNIRLDSNLTPYHVRPQQIAKKSQNNSGFTVFNFINTNCGSCYETMDRWTDYLLKLNYPVQVIFIASGETNEYFTNYFKSKKDVGFDVYLDPLNNFSEKNGLVIYKKETFLVNNNGDVILYGDPTKNSIVDEYYNYVLNEKKSF